MKTAYYGPESFPAENMAVGDFVSSIIWGEPDKFADYCTMGVFDGNRLIAGVVYHNWHPDDGVIELSSGGTDPRWATRNVLKAMFWLAFNGLEARMVVLRISGNNSKMRSIAKRLGFSETIIPRLRGDNEAESVCTLHADDWRNNRLSR